MVEHLALWEKIKNRGNFGLVCRSETINIAEPDRHLNVSLIPEASDQYTLWFQNEWIHMTQNRGLTTLVVSENYPYKNKLSFLG